MKRLLFLLLSLSLGLNAGLLYVRYADQPHQPGPRPGKPPHQQGHRPPPRPEMMVEQQLEAKTRHLELDSAQQKAIRDILEKHLPAIAELRERTGEANRQMTEVYAADSFDEADFQRLMLISSHTRSQSDSLSAVILMEEASVLNDEQRRLFAEVAPMSQNIGQRPPPRQDGRPGGRPGGRQGGRPGERRQPPPDQRP